MTKKTDKAPIVKTIEATLPDVSKLTEEEKAKIRSYGHDLYPRSVIKPAPVKKTAETTLTIKRSGEFSVITYGLTHCGAQTSSSRMKVRYSFTCKCAATNLDARGFLFDQTRIEQFMQAQTSTSLSCEQFAIQLSRDLFKQITRENALCQPSYLALTLSPEPFQAELTFEWTK